MKKLMNSQGVLLVSTVLMAALAALLRRYQLGKELLNDGTLLPGSKMQVILPILLALYAAAVIVLLRPLRKKRSWQEVFPPTPLLNGVQIFCALLLFVGNISTLTKPAGSAQQLVSAFSIVLTRIRPWMGFAAALCMAAFAGMRMSRQKPTAVLYIAVSVYLVVRLILSFQSWNTDPSIHDYALRLLASICCMLGTYQLAGFCLDVGRRRMTAFWALCGTVFSAVGFVDSVYQGDAGEALVSLSLCLFMFVNAIQVLYARGRRTRRPIVSDPAPAPTPPSESSETAD